MNFETGVIPASSPSIGVVCAPAGANNPATRRAASVTIANRVITRLLSWNHPCRAAARFYSALGAVATESRSVNVLNKGHSDANLRSTHTAYSGGRFVQPPL